MSLDPVQSLRTIYHQGQNGLLASLTSMSATFRESMGDDDRHDDLNDAHHHKLSKIAPNLKHLRINMETPDSMNRCRSFYLQLASLNSLESIQYRIPHHCKLLGLEELYHELVLVLTLYTLRTELRRLRRIQVVLPTFGERGQICHVLRSRIRDALSLPVRFVSLDEAGITPDGHANSILTRIPVTNVIERVHNGWTTTNLHLVTQEEWETAHREAIAARLVRT